jgi:UDP-N-acetylglucosamine 1-carboxyvinyltransferase
MDRIRLIGGVELRGRVQISGAKNAALPAMAASLLTPQPVHLDNLPYVRDILTMKTLLAELFPLLRRPMNW